MTLHCCGAHSVEHQQHQPAYVLTSNNTSSPIDALASGQVLTMQPAGHTPWTRSRRRCGARSTARRCAGTRTASSSAPLTGCPCTSARPRLRAWQRWHDRWAVQVIGQQHSMTFNIAGERAKAVDLSKESHKSIRRAAIGCMPRMCGRFLRSGRR